MEGIYSKEKTRVMVYTRLPQQGVIQMDWHIAFTLHGAGMESLIIR